MATFKEGIGLDQADRLIIVDGKYYAIYDYTTIDGNTMPLVIEVDVLDVLANPGAAIETSIEQFESDTGYIFQPIFMVSQLSKTDPTDETTDLDYILNFTRNQLEKKANVLGKKWFLNDDIQRLFALQAITGEDISEYLEPVLEGYGTADEREWIELVYRNHDKAEEIVYDNYENLLLSVNQMRITGPGLDSLLKDLAADVSSGKFGTGQAAAAKVNEIISYLTDSVKRNMAGGINAVDEEYRKYVGEIDETQSGIAAAYNLVKDYLGEDIAKTYRSNGMLEQYAGLLRADGSAGYTEGGGPNETKIINDLQAAHDKIFPGFEGSKHKDWSGPIYEIGSTTLGKDFLTAEEKKQMDLISQKVGGDMNLYEQELRTQFKNDADYQDKVLLGATSVFNQDISGVFVGQGMSRR